MEDLYLLPIEALKINNTEIGWDTDVYGYVLNDPVNWVDPEGLHGIFLLKGRGTFINIPRFTRFSNLRYIPRTRKTKLTKEPTPKGEELLDELRPFPYQSPTGSYTPDG
ncbi:MAG: hypothetical protein SWO11_11660, partial [Thermodesulfobacteriota bacterium]|nr:hypothetical protein [Thermodesulfobacteriota bacterium]